MDKEKIWKGVWNIIALIFAFFLAKSFAARPIDKEAACILFILSSGAKVMAEYGADWFDIF